MDPAQAQQQAMHMMALMIPMILVFWVISAAILVIPFWQIFKKAGMAPGLSFLMILPLVNLIMLYVLAFSEWKTVPVAGLYPPVYPPAAYPPTSQTAYPPPPPEPPSAL